MPGLGLIGSSAVFSALPLKSPDLISAEMAPLVVLSTAWVNVGKPTTKPSTEGRAHLESLLGEWLVCDYEVVDHVAAVRPVTHTRHPILGRHPAHPQVAVFGGLGSKGVLTAPHYASVLLEHLLNGTALPREVDIAIH